MTKMMMLMQFLKNEDGVTMIEYSLIAALIAMVAITGVTATGLKVNAFFESVVVKK